MNRIAIITMLALAGCDIEVNACEYDEDGNPPVVASQCFRAVGEPSDNPAMLPLFPSDSCESWCVEEGMEPVTKMVLQSKAACPGLGDPAWETVSPSSPMEPGVVRCVCGL